MSRFNKWVPFFEESSEQRDVASWDKFLKAGLPDQGVKVIGLVSDRAKALVKLGESDYLDATSMPDLFHFQQDMGKLGGLQIGRQYQQAQRDKAQLKEQSNVSAAQVAATEAFANERLSIYEQYRQESRAINQTIHPFDSTNNWSNPQQVSKRLTQSVLQVSKLTEQLNLSVDLSKANKVLRQIPAIVAGIDNWIKISQGRIEQWLKEGIINKVEKLWFTMYLLPLVYWQTQLSRTKNGRSNPSLVAVYQQRVEESQKETIEKMIALKILPNRQEVLLEMAQQMAKSFQRSSSQVEGRNGYLAFIHHGQKGIPAQKRKALTVIHNFDTKQVDGSTPAQRLFKKDFPDLFEFLCENVTGFKEPRKRKSKVLKNSILQR
ncbi:MAG: DUF6399 domain-containing protein [Bacteroidota bacterium]